MTRTEFLEVRFGQSRWLKIAQILISTLGLLAILATPANFVWKLCSILLLLLASWCVFARSFDENRAGTIRLFADGTAFLRIASMQETNAFQGPQGWATRCLSILTLREAVNGRKHYCIICASDNNPNEYRRLLKFLRMQAAPAAAQRIIW